MGGCFSLGRKGDLTGNTFSHYSLSSQSEHIDLYPGFRYAETEASVCEDSASAWRRSSVPLLDSWDPPHTRPQDAVSQASTVSQCNTLASELCEQMEASSSPKSHSSSSSPSHHHRDNRAFFWNRALVRLRNSFRGTNKISSDSSLAPYQQNSSAKVNSACVRLSTTSTSVEEDFV